MEKFIPYEKLSKKKKRELNARKRTTWGPLNPVTRRSPDPRAYNRQKARRWKVDDRPDAPSFFADFSRRRFPRRARLSESPVPALVPPSVIGSEGTTCAVRV